MIAYYVHDEKKKDDIIVLPDPGCAVPVDRQRMEAGIVANTVNIASRLVIKPRPAGFQTGALASSAGAVPPATAARRGTKS